MHSLNVEEKLVTLLQSENKFSGIAPVIPLHLRNVASNDVTLRQFVNKFSGMFPS